MSFLKNLFKPKPGGTAVGNLLRAGAKLGKTAAGTALNLVVPGAGTVLQKLPIGEGLMMKQPEVQETVAESVSLASLLPPQTHEQSKAVAKEAKTQLIAQTGDVEFADKVGQAVYEAAAAPAAKASDKSTIKTELKKILNGALEGAKDGALDTYLNETGSGKQVVKDATTNQVNKYLPFAAGGVILYLLLKK